LYTAYCHDGPSAVRYPRGGGKGVAPEKQMTALPLGRAEVRRSGRKVALLAFGSMLAPALPAGEQIEATVVNMRFAKPLDEDCIRDLAATHELIVSIEENAVVGGAGGEVARVLDALTQRPRMLRLGLPDRFEDHGEQGQLLSSIGLDAAG